LGLLGFDLQETQCLLTVSLIGQMAPQLRKGRLPLMQPRSAKENGIPFKKVGGCETVRRPVSLRHDRLRCIGITTSAVYGSHIRAWTQCKSGSTSQEMMGQGMGLPTISMLRSSMSWSTAFTSFTPSTECSEFVSHLGSLASGMFWGEVVDCVFDGKIEIKQKQLLSSRMESTRGGNASPTCAV